MYFYHEIVSRYLVLSFIATLAFLIAAVNSSFHGCNEYKLEKNISLIIDGCETIDCEESITERLRNISLHQVFGEIFKENRLLTSVSISTAPLWQIPPELCNLKHLRTLQLQKNCLSSLPLNCFDQLLNLEAISITHNRIEVLPDGLFDGLHKLDKLYLDFNNIKVIGDRFLTNDTDLAGLRVVSLRKNQLTSIGPWPLIHASAKNKFQADLEYNNISSFTNNLKAKFKCNTSRGSDLDIMLNFRGNNIHHLSDMIYPYFGDILTMVCFFTGGKYHTRISVDLGVNPFSCDCMDYKFRTILAKFSRISLMNDVRCSEPPDLRNERYVAVPIELFVCNFTGTALCISDCQCIYQPSSARFKIHCSARTYPVRRNGLPESLPPIGSITNTTAYYNLKLSGRYVPSLEKRDYFKSTKRLDLSGVQMKSITDDAIRSLAHVEDLNLCCNLLETLPKSVANVTLATKTLKLYGNFWRCECSDAWMKEWLTDVKDKLENPYDIYCSSPQWLAGRVLLTIEKQEFCENPALKQRNQIIYWSVISAATVLLVVVVIVCVMKRFKVEMHAYLNLHPFDKDECVGENMLYDVFFSSSYADRLFGVTLVRQLESKGYRVCYHEKDFIGGRSIADNICHAVVRSKRVVCYISKDFIESAYCMYEFETALHRNIQTKRQRLLALVDESLLVNEATVPDEVYQFLTNHTYIELKLNKNWMAQLLYSLAVKKLGNETSF